MMKKMMQAWLLGAVLSSAMIASNAFAQGQIIDRVAVIVNDGVITESSVADMMRMVKQQATQSGQALPTDETLRVQVVDRLIARELQLQMAQRYGIDVSDAQVEQAINGIASEQGMNVEQLRQLIETNGDSWSAYRDDMRQQLIVQEVQRNAVQQRVYVSPQEIEGLVRVIDESNQAEQEYRLRHILVPLPDGASSDTVTEVRANAENVIKLARDGTREFADLAISVSAGREALEGGDMGWMNINEMPSLFADAVNNTRKGDIVGPLRSGVGFHILKVEDTRGIETVEVEEVLARHILIQPSVILSDKRAREMLQGFYQQLQAGTADFAELAREHSADPGSAAKGGELGWSRPDVYAEAFKNTINRLDVGELSEPFESQFGWHIVEVLDRRVQDNTEASKRDRAYQLLFQRKYREELANWQQEMRDQAYVEMVAE